MIATKNFRIDTKKVRNEVMKLMKHREQIFQFITDELLYGDSGQLTNATPLLDEGLLDSLGMLRMVEFLESEFKITVAAEEINRKNFKSIDALAGFVEDKTI